MKTNQNTIPPTAVALALVSLIPGLAQDQFAPLEKEPNALNAPDQDMENFWQQPSYLGVSMRELNFPARQNLPLNPDECGVILEEIFPNSPAEIAGLRIGDILLSVEGTRLESPDDLVEQVQAKQPKESIKIKLLRGEQRMAIDVTLAAMPAAFEEAMEEQRARVFQAQPQFDVPEFEQLEEFPLIIPNEGQLLFADNIEELLKLEPDQRIKQLREQMRLNQLDLQERLEQQMQQLQNGQLRGNWMKQKNGNTTIEMHDGEGRVRITSQEGEKPFVEVFDPEGELLFSDNLESLEDTLEDVPEEHQERIRSALNLNGAGNTFNFEFNFDHKLRIPPQFPQAEGEANEDLDPNQATKPPPGFH